MAVVTDAFDRANGGLGTNWTTTTSQAAPQINSNGVVPNAVAGPQSRARGHNLTTIGADQYAQVTIIALNQGSGNSFGGVDLRVASGAQTYYSFKMFGVPGGNVFQELLKTVAGVETTLASTSAQPIAVNDVVRCEVVGTQLTGFVNGVVRLGPVTDTAIAGGQPGLNIATSVGVVTDAKVDNWEGGDLTAAQGTIFNRMIG